MTTISESDVFSTKQVARLLGVPVHRVGHAVWDGRIPAPRRSPSGDFLWTEADVRRACRELLGRNLDDVLGAMGGKETDNE